MNGSAKNALHQAWFPAQAQNPPPDGLTTLRQALIAMEGGLPLDAGTAAHLRAAFRAFLYEGKSDLTANLGLRPGKGRKCEAPLRLERMTRRDTLIKQALQRLGGNRPESRRMLADVLGMASSAVVDRFDQLEGALRKACPDLPDEAKTVLQQVIATARNEWIRSTERAVFDRIDAMLTAQDDGADEASTEEEGAA